MKFWLGVTDINWYTYLSGQGREDVNFWRPGGKSPFNILQPGAPFLFKLKSPINAIGGVGFFSCYTTLPLTLAWDAFGNGNGCSNIYEFQRMILGLREDKSNLNPTIGCIVLTNPIFFKKSDWISMPENWSKSTQQGKSYSIDDPIGLNLWDQIQERLNNYLFDVQPEEKSQLILESPEPLYGKDVLTKVRLGQGAFRVLVTDAYNRRCAISGEKTMPVLEAAHIKPYAESGPHFISNSLLLRSDLHKLFDAGYITITKDHKIEVSNRIREEFQNGKEYYRFHGVGLSNRPVREMDLPGERFVEWHNENIFRG